MHFGHMLRANRNLLGKPGLAQGMAYGGGISNMFMPYDGIENPED